MGLFNNLFQRVGRALGMSSSAPQEDAITSISTVATDDAIRALTALEEARVSANLSRDDERYKGRVAEIGERFQERSADSGMDAVDAQKKWQKLTAEITAKTRGGWSEGR
ncbi:MAG: hypothetical protein EB060_10060 [Proteobacteria bacterium]|nr:hypothetical protein [Pseudomonadota bacterium]